MSIHLTPPLRHLCVSLRPSSEAMKIANSSIRLVSYHRTVFQNLSPPCESKLFTIGPPSDSIEKLLGLFWTTKIKLAPYGDSKGISVTVFTLINMIDFQSLLYFDNRVCFAVVVEGIWSF